MPCRFRRPGSSGEARDSRGGVSLGSSLPTTVSAEREAVRRVSFVYVPARAIQLRVTSASSAAVSSRTVTA